MRKIQINLFDEKSIDKAIKELEAFSLSLEDKAKAITGDLAEIGVRTASQSFATVDYDAVNDAFVSKVETKNGHIVRASGDSVAFIEFGSGARYGYGHPKPVSEDGQVFGPGTWSMSEKGIGQWDNPDGWLFQSGGRWIRSFGNRPAKGMYNAEMDIMAADIKGIAEKHIK